MQTIGDALGKKWRDIVVTDTAIRTRMRLGHENSTAASLINDYVARKNQAHKAEPRVGRDGTRSVRSKNYSSTWFPSEDGTFVDLSESREENQGGDVSTRLDLAGDTLEIQVDVQRKMDSTTSISLATPSILRTLADHKNVGLREAENDDPIVAHAIDIYKGDAWLHDRIFQRSRTLAIIALGWPVLLDEQTIQKLAERVCGLAHVVVCRDEQISFDISDAFGKQWSVYNSALRLYGSGITFDDDPRRASRMVLRDTYWTANDTDITRTLDDLVISAGRYVQTKLVDIPMPSREVALERARRRDVERAQTAASDLLANIVARPDPEKPPTETPVFEAIHVAVDTPASAPIDEAYRERLAELQAEIDAFRKANSLLTEEHEYQRQLAESYEETAKRQQEDLDHLKKLVEPAMALVDMTPAWRATVVTLIESAVHASDKERHNEDLEETLVNLRGHQSLLEHRSATHSSPSSIPLPQPQDTQSLIAYLGTKYPGVFAIYGQGSRSYKKTDPYDNPDRFLETLDVLGTHYYAWKIATGSEVLPCQRAFEDRCTALCLKATPSATTQGYNVHPDEHTVRLSSGRKTPMYELRDVGTTFEQRHMLYLGYAWDDEAGQIVLARFNHPIVLSART